MEDPGADVIDFKRAIDREVDLVTSAINMVASGRAPSMTVAGLRLAEAAIRIVRPLADASGVVIVPLWGPDEDTTDVKILPGVAPAG